MLAVLLRRRLRRDPGGGVVGHTLVHHERRTGLRCRRGRWLGSPFTLATWFCSVSESLSRSCAHRPRLPSSCWRAQPWGWGVIALASTASLILVASYETALATSTILGLMGDTRRHARQRCARERIGCAIVLALAYGRCNRREPLGILSRARTTRTRARFAYFVVSLMIPLPVYAALACGALVVGGFVVSNRRLRAALLVSGLGGAAARDSQPRPHAKRRICRAWRRRDRGSRAPGLSSRLSFGAAGTAVGGERRRLCIRSFAGRFLVVPVVFVAAMCAANIRCTRRLVAWSGRVRRRGGRGDRARLRRRRPPPGPRQSRLGLRRNLALSRRSYDRPRAACWWIATPASSPSHPQTPGRFRSRHVHLASLIQLAGGRPVRARTGAHPS